MKKRKKTSRTCQTRRGCLNSVLTWRGPDHRRRRRRRDGVSRGARYRTPGRRAGAAHEPSSSSDTRRRRVGRDVSSSHSRPARTSSAKRPPRPAIEERHRALGGELAPRVRSGRPSGRVSAILASPSSNASASRRCRRLLGVRRRAPRRTGRSARPRGVARSRAAQASISACVGSSAAASSVLASPDALPVDPSCRPPPGSLVVDRRFRRTTSVRVARRPPRCDGRASAPDRSNQVVLSWV